MRRALTLARRGRGRTSPNPAVGAVLIREGRLLGEGWHRRAGSPHAEIEALRDAEGRGHSTDGATLFVTLEPCSTHGRTPPCTEAVVRAGITRVVVAAVDPNPRHAGRGLDWLRRRGIAVTSGVLAEPARQLNEAFNHWIVAGTPLVTVKAAMTLDGKIATAAGESKWITGPAARKSAQQLRFAADAVLVGVNTVLADDPALTCRAGESGRVRKALRRVILDTHGRTPLTAKLLNDEEAGRTLLVLGRDVSIRQRAGFERKVRVWRAPLRRGKIDPRWLLRRLGAGGVTHLLVEGGGEVNASFLEGGLAQRVAFFYAPKILGGHDARPGVAGTGARHLRELINLTDVRLRRCGEDLLVTARVGRGHS